MWTRRALPVFFVVTVLAAIAFASEQRQIWFSSQQKQELTALNKRLVRAYLNEDVKVLRAMLHESHVHNNVFGMPLSKEQFLGDIDSGLLVFESYETERLKWHLDGDTAIATGVISAKAVRGGRPVPADRFLFTRVFVRNAGEWKVLLFHNTMMPSQAKAENDE